MRFVETMLERLKTIDVHDAYFILKNVMLIPKLIFTIRTAPIYDSPKFQHFDRLVKEFSATLLNTKLSNNSWLQATLPINLGGIGLRSLESIASSAFLASIHQCQQIINILINEESSSAIDEEIEKALTFWSLKHHMTTAHYPDIKTSQKSWDHPCAVKFQQKLLDHFDNPENKARLLSISQEHASDWLLATPLPSLGLKLDNKTFRIACGLRLGSNVCHQHLCQ